MSKKYNLDNCDILNHDGQLLLVYDDGVGPVQKLLVFSKSYHDFNEKAIKLMGGEDWMNYLFYMDEEFPGDLITRLLADMYEHHNEIYMNLYKKMYYDAQPDSLTEYEKYRDDGYLTMHVVRTDENGYRWAVFDKEGVWDLDDETLNMLAEDMEIPNYDLKTHAELIKEICSDECDIDSDEYDCDCEVECGGNCGNCGWKDVNDDDVEIPDMHDTGRLDTKGRKIFEYDRHEIEDLSMNTLCDMADSLMVDLDDVMDKDDLIDKLCDVVALVDSDHKDWPQQVVSKVEVSPQGTQQYESVDGPQHYNGTECIEEMRNLYGDDAVRWFCVCNAYKYRFRKGNKPGQDAAQDEAKARWYEKYASDMMRNTQY